jgi:hypothetical protein
LALAGEAAGRWADLAPSERLARLADLPACLEAQGAGRRCARALGLEDGEWTGPWQQQLLDLRIGLELCADATAGQAWAFGAGLFRAHWSDFAAPLALRLAVALWRGRTAIVCSDPRWPDGAAILAEACASLDLPRGTLSVLHGLEWDQLRANLPAAGLFWLRASDHAPRLESLAAALPAHMECRLFSPENASAALDEKDDPGQVAARILERAWSREWALGGQAPGQLARVACPQRLHSSLTAQLLAHLDQALRSTPAGSPLTCLEDDLPAYAAEQWSLGLDEGAAPLWGGAPGPRSRAGTTRARPCPAPILFTNVEPHQALVRHRRPAPVLSLLRVPDGAAARRLLSVLDGGRRPLPLSGPAFP